MDINEKIERRMTEKGLSQADLSRLTGASKGAVNHWLSGVSRPGNKYLKVLCGTLECSLEWLLDDSASLFFYAGKKPVESCAQSSLVLENSSELGSDEVWLPFFDDFEVLPGGLANAYPGGL